MGSHKMKLVTVGLALATVAKALDCENGTVDMQPGSSDHIDWCNANAEKCKDSDVQVCMFSDEFDEVAEANPITMDDVNEPEPTPEPVPVIQGRRGGIAKNTEVRVTRTWVDDVEEYCRVNKKACKNQWGSRVARQLENFREKMDNAFKQEAAAHYNEFMAYANDRCFNRIKQCNSKISSVGSVEIPSYENFWNFGCMECFVTSMRLIKDLWRRPQAQRAPRSDSRRQEVPRPGQGGQPHPDHRWVEEGQVDQEEHSFSPQEALRSLTVPGTEALCCLLQHLPLFLVTLHLQLEIKT